MSFASFGGTEFIGGDGLVGRLFADSVNAGQGIALASADATNSLPNERAAGTGQEAAL